MTKASKMQPQMVKEHCHLRLALEAAASRLPMVAVAVPIAPSWTRKLLAQTERTEGCNHERSISLWRTEGVLEATDCCSRMRVLLVWD